MRGRRQTLSAVCRQSLAEGSEASELDSTQRHSTFPESHGCFSVNERQERGLCPIQTRDWGEKLKRDRWESNPQPSSLSLVLGHTQYKKRPACEEWPPGSGGASPGKRGVSVPCNPGATSSAENFSSFWAFSHRRFVKGPGREIYRRSFVPTAPHTQFQPTADILQSCLHRAWAFLLSAVFFIQPPRLTAELSLPAVSSTQPQKWPNFAAGQL